MGDGGGISKLAQVMAARIATQADHPDALELGTIGDDLSLKVDRFAVALPAGQYLVAEWTAELGLPPFSLVGSGEFPVEDDGTPEPVTEWTDQTRWDLLAKDIKEVAVRIKPELKPGDRVLVAWVGDGTDPVVVCKVVSS